MHTQDTNPNTNRTIKQKLIVEDSFMRNLYLNISLDKDAVITYKNVQGGGDITKLPLVYVGTENSGTRRNTLNGKVYLETLKTCFTSSIANCYGFGFDTRSTLNHLSLQNVAGKNFIQRAPWLENHEGLFVDTFEFGSIDNVTSVDSFTFKNGSFVNFFHHYPEFDINKSPTIKNLLLQSITNSDYYTFYQTVKATLNGTVQTISFPMFNNSTAKNIFNNAAYITNLEMDHVTLDYFFNNSLLNTTLTLPFGFVGTATVAPTMFGTIETLAIKNSTIEHFYNLSTISKDFSVENSTISTLALGKINKLKLSNSSIDIDFINGANGATIQEFELGNSTIKSFANAGSLNGLDLNGMVIKGDFANTGTITEGLTFQNNSKITGDFINTGSLEKLTLKSTSIGGSLANAGTLEEINLQSSTIVGSLQNQGSLEGITLDSSSVGGFVNTGTLELSLKSSTIVGALYNQGSLTGATLENSVIKGDFYNAGSIENALSLSSLNITGNFINTGSLKGLTLENPTTAGNGGSSNGSSVRSDVGNNANIGIEGSLINQSTLEEIVLKNVRVGGFYNSKEGNIKDFNLENSELKGNFQNQGSLKSFTLDSTPIQGSFVNTGTIAESLTLENTSSITGDFINTGSLEKLTLKSTSIGGSLANAGTLEEINLQSSTIVGSLHNLGSLEGITLDSSSVGGFVNTGTLDLSLKSSSIKGDFKNQGSLKSFTLDSTPIQGSFVNTGTIAESLTLENTSSITGDFINTGSLEKLTLKSTSIGGSLANAGTLEEINLQSSTIVGSLHNLGSLEGITLDSSSVGGFTNTKVLNNITIKTGTLGSFLNTGTTKSLDLDTATLKGSFTNSGDLQAISLKAVNLQGDFINHGELGGSNKTTLALLSLSNPTPNTTTIDNTKIQGGFVNTGNIKDDILFKQSTLTKDFHNLGKMQGVSLENSKIHGSFINEGILQELSLTQSNITKGLTNKATINTNISDDESSSIPRIDNQKLIGGSIILKQNSNINIDNAFEAKIGKGIVYEGSGTLTLDSLGEIGYYEQDSKKESLKLTKGQATLTNILSWDSQKFIISGDNQSKAMVGTLTIDVVKTKFTQEDKRPLREFLEGGDVSKIEVKSSDKTGMIRLYYDKETELISIAPALNNGPAAHVGKVLSNLATRRTSFIDNVMANSLRSLLAAHGGFSTMIDTKASGGNALREAYTDGSSLSLQRRLDYFASVSGVSAPTYGISSRYASNVAVDAPQPQEGIESNIVEQAHQNLLLPNSTPKDDVFFVLPYLSYLEVDMGNAVMGTGHNKGVIAGYSRYNHGNLYGVYAGYETTDVSGAFYDVGSKLYYAGLQSYYPLKRVNENQELFIRASSSLAISRNSVKRKEEFGEAEGKPMGISYGLGADLGMNIKKDNDIFIPEIGIAYDGGVLRSFEMQGVVFGGAEKNYQAKTNLYQAKVNLSWYRNWGLYFKTMLQGGVRYNFNNVMRLRGRIGDLAAEDTHTLPVVNAFVGGSVIVPLNQSFYFSLNYTHNFNKSGKSHTGYAKFNYLW